MSQQTEAERIAYELSPIIMTPYLRDLEAKNADMVRIGIQFTGSSCLDSMAVRRVDLDLYAIGTPWMTADCRTPFVVVSHPSEA